MQVSARSENFMKARMKNAYERKKCDIHKGIIEQECNRSLFLINRSIRDVRTTLREIRAISGYVHEAWAPVSKSVSRESGLFPGKFASDDQEAKQRRDLETHAVTRGEANVCGLGPRTENDPDTVDRPLGHDAGATSLFTLRKPSINGNLGEGEVAHVTDDSSFRKKRGERDVSGVKFDCSANINIELCSSPDSDSENELTPGRRQARSPFGKGKWERGDDQSFGGAALRETQPGGDGEVLERGLKEKWPRRQTPLSSDVKLSDPATESAALHSGQATRERNARSVNFLRPVSEQALSRRGRPHRSPAPNCERGAPPAFQDSCASQRCRSALLLQGELSWDGNGRMCADRDGYSLKNTAIDRRSPKRFETQQLARFSPVAPDRNKQKAPTLRAKKTRLKSADCPPGVFRGGVGLEGRTQEPEILVDRYCPLRTDTPERPHRLPPETAAAAVGTWDSARVRVVMSRSAIQRSLRQLVLQYNQPRSVNHLEKERQKHLQAKVSAFVAILAMQKESTVK